MSPLPREPIAPEPGSFRDRNAQVYYRDGKVLRALGPRATDEWRQLSASAFFRRALAEGTVVGTEDVSARELPLAEAGPWSAVLEHERVPFVSYPYEWCAGMLRDAALVQLDLLRAALTADMILKDATPFNVQWRGVRPLFIDVASFERLAPGQPWAAYRQFCEMFLYPLLLQSYRGVAFQAWLRGRLDGISSDTCWRLLSTRDLLRPGVLTHVYLQRQLQARYERADWNVRQQLREAGFRKELIVANANRLASLLGRLTWRTGSHWSAYATQHGYTDTDLEAKVAFVEEIAQSRRWGLAWDLGCNTGRFARLLARQADYVVAMDSDPAVIDALYAALRAERLESILPLVVDLADPSPDLGWRGRERRALLHRGAPDLTVCLALVHHLALAANIPIHDLIEWLASLRSALVIEFVTRRDPMVATLLRHKRDDYADYDVEPFERELGDHFDVVQRRSISGGTRILYFATPR